MNARSSRLEGFYQKSRVERARLVAAWADLDQTDYVALEGGGLSPDSANTLIENVVGLFALPLGVATNFVINGKDYLIPMVIEEPSVVAACSNAARLAREGGGFDAWADEPVMIAQIQVLDVPDLDAARNRLREAEPQLLQQANALHPSIAARGGGARGIEQHVVQTETGTMLIVHLLYDVRDAMGANAVNTAAEALAPAVEDLTGGRVLLRILSNLADRRLAGAYCRIPLAALATAELAGAAVAEGIVAAWAFADADPHRAATHNKGVMNGVDAVLLATGNDWRAAEAGAHAYAARAGRYGSLTKWSMAEGTALAGEIKLPMAVGTVGGTTRAHPAARAAIKILGISSARELAQVAAAVGLAQNLAAIRALATEGIQKGHMRLHARRVLEGRKQ